MQDDSIVIEDDCKMTVSIWKMTVSIWKMTVSIWDILSLCNKAGTSNSSTPLYIAAQRGYVVGRCRLTQ